MWKIPGKVSLVAGHGEGETPLTAFDNALQDAGIAHASLVRVTSIFPPGAEVVSSPEIPEGMLLPVTFDHIVSDKPGEVIVAAIGVGIPKDKEEGGVIVEHKGVGKAAKIEEAAREMVEEMFRRRNRELEEIRVISAEHKVEKLGCAVAAAIFLE